MEATIQAAAPAVELSWRRTQCREHPPMLTHNFMFGMNLISLAGFVVMGAALAMQRQRKLGTPALFGLMAIGTALLFVGFYLHVP